MYCNGWDVNFFHKRRIAEQQQQWNNSKKEDAEDAKDTRTSTNERRHTQELKAFGTEPPLLRVLQRRKPAAVPVDGGAERPMPVDEAKDFARILLLRTGPQDDLEPACMGQRGEQPCGRRRCPNHALAYF